MSHLVAIAYPDERRAAEVLAALERLEAEGAIEVEDAAAVSKDDLGGIKLDRVLGHAAAGAAVGAAWGGIVGMIFLVPAVGAAFGAGVGALAGKLVGAARGGAFGDFGLHVRDHMPPGSSAVLMLVRKRDPEKAIAELRQYGGTVLRTTLPDEIEAQLRGALEQLEAGATE